MGSKHFYKKINVFKPFIDLLRLPQTFSLYKTLNFLTPERIWRAEEFSVKRQILAFLIRKKVFSEKANFGQNLPFVAKICLFTESSKWA